MTWPLGRAPTEAAAAPAAAPAPQASYPLPTGRGRWRLTLHERQFSSSTQYDSTIISEISHARSRRLEQAWNKPATFSFTVDGTSAAAGLIRELMTDVVVWRWDEARKDVPVFRGIVAQSQDTLSEQANSVTFTCHDYLAMLERRLLPAKVTYLQSDQDDLVTALVGKAKAALASDGSSFGAGAYLPLQTYKVDPAGATRNSKSGQLRDRTYEAQQKIDEAVFNLAAVEAGFDFDAIPNVYGTDLLRIFYPYQGVLRTDLVLDWGGNLSTVSRTVNSADYSNYWRVVGASSDANNADAPPMYAEKWNTDSNNVTIAPVGLWQSGDNASDVSLQATLNDKAGANLSQSGILLPSYSLGLRPGWYTWGNPSMGDVIRLRIRAGRLDVDSDVRVLGLTYDIGDDGQEDVQLTVGRPDITFGDLFTRADRDINALARR